jgi:hypothetical protein
MASSLNSLIDPIAASYAWIGSSGFCALRYHLVPVLVYGNHSDSFQCFAGPMETKHEWEQEESVAVPPVFFLETQ